MQHDDEPFRLGRYELERIKGSPNYYRKWYEPRTGKGRRKSLKTSDPEEAKILLAQIVLEEGALGADPAEGGEPKQVNLITVFNHYWKHYSDNRPRPRDARYACETLFDYLDAALPSAPRVSDLTLARQRAFMVYSAEKLGHGVSTISRNLSIVNAALNFCASAQIIIDVNGDEREVTILKFAPKVHYAYELISKVTGLPLPKSAAKPIALEDLASFVESIEHEHLFRYVVLALNTWGRPEALLALGPEMIDRQHGLLDMNPAGRRQNKKRRPTIGITKNLEAWIDHWETVDRDEHGAPLGGPWVQWRGKPIKDIKKTFQAHRDALGEDGKPRFSRDITRYGLRHLMATVARNSRKPRVPKEQRQIMLGHVDPDARITDGYGVYEPDFLREALGATDAFLMELNRAIRSLAKAEGRMPRRLMIPPKGADFSQNTRKTGRATKPGGAENTGKVLKVIGKNGGR